MKKKMLVLAGLLIMAMSMTSCGNENAVSSNTATSSDNASKQKESASANEALNDINKETGNISEEIKDSNTSKEETFEVISLEAEVIINGQSVLLGDDMNVLSEKLGSTDFYQEVDSYSGTGKDRIYGYGQIMINTVPDGDKDLVNLINIEKGGVLPGGIVVGTSTREDAINTYDNITDGGSFLECKASMGIIYFELEENTVVHVEIYNN